MDRKHRQSVRDSIHSMERKAIRSLLSPTCFLRGSCIRKTIKTEQVIARRDDMPPADRTGSTSVRGRIRSPHSTGGLA